MTSVIIVDDNKDIVSSLSEILEFHGINVLGKGYNGFDAVQLFNQHNPDVVLLDLQMPEYDGLYALRIIREKDVKASVIIITGGIPDSQSDEIHLLRPAKIMIKPVDVNTLIESILDASNNNMPFKIKYSFNDDLTTYTCILTSVQYQNFKKLPVLQKCEIINKDEKNIESYQNEMQHALNLAAKNDVTHIQKLSEAL